MESWHSVPKLRSFDRVAECRETRLRGGLHEKARVGSHRMSGGVGGSAGEAARVCARQGFAGRDQQWQRRRRQALGSVGIELDDRFARREHGDHQGSEKNCAVTVTVNQANADYTIMMNRESKKNRGLLRSNSQVQVANRAGDVLGTSATHTVGNASKDACQLILADWQEHGRMNAQESPAPQATAPAASPAVVPAVATQGQPSGARLQNAAATTGTAAGQPATDPVVTSVTVSTAPTVAEAAKKQKQHQACLDLAKDNPSIVCK